MNTNRFATLKNVNFNAPDEGVIAKYTRNAEGRDDYEPASLVLFTIMMWTAGERAVEKVEARFGSKGSKVCRESVMASGAEAAARYVAPGRPPRDLSELEAAAALCLKGGEILGSTVTSCALSGTEARLPIDYSPVEGTQLRPDCPTNRYWLQGFVDAGCRLLGLPAFRVGIRGSAARSGGYEYTVARGLAEENSTPPVEQGLRPVEELNRLSAPPRVQPKKKTLQGKNYRVPFAIAFEALKGQLERSSHHRLDGLVTSGKELGSTVLDLFKAVERELGAPGQAACSDAMVEVGHEIGKQVLFDRKFTLADRTIENLANYVSWLNYYPYASPEIERIDDSNSYTLDVHWCPVQDLYKAFDCRVMRYLMEGHLKAANDHGLDNYDMRCIRTMPDGAETCQFTMWGVAPEVKNAWFDYTAMINAKALKHAEKAKK
jgi:hypothetical protein